MVDASLSEIMKFFEMSPADFRKEWAELSDEDKKYFRESVAQAIGK